MNFYERQDRARSESRLLYFLFFLLVAFTVCATYVSILYVLQSSDPNNYALKFILYWDQKIFFITAGSVLFVLFIGYLQKIGVTSSGENVANYYGGRVVPLSTDDPKERQLLNVVEEMSLASGTPIPVVYILDDENGINAFAAGLTPDSSVVAVTRGALDNLNREELQGVIGHELSHIINLDVSLNLRLLGIVAGFFIFFDLGRIMLRSLGRSSSRRSKGAGGLVLISFALFVLGLFGVVMGRILQAAFSRQREYLADASSTQFTRNPLALASALRKIERHDLPSSLRHEGAADISHMMFDSAPLFGLFSTHPPLKSRIQYLDKNNITSDIKYSPKIKKTEVTGGVKQQPVSVAASAAYAVASLPHIAEKNSKDALGAQALIIGALLNHGHGGVDFETTHKDLKQIFLPEVFNELVKILPEVNSLSRRQTFTLVEKSCWALQFMSKPQALNFLNCLEKIAALDQTLELFELAIIEIVRSQLKRRLGDIRLPEKSSKLQNYISDIVVSLSVFALQGSNDIAAAQKAFDRGLANVGLPSQKLQELNRNELAKALSPALSRLINSSLVLRRHVLAAITVVTQTDGVLTDSEHELLRMYSLCFGVPTT